MLTLYRLAPVRFTSFAMMMSFVVLGLFDTAKAQSLTVSPSSLTFTTAQGGNPSNTQTVNVTSTGGTLNYLISTNATWISASTGPFNGTGGSAPDALTVEILSSSLPSGNYTGTITLAPANGTAAASIAVSLTVSGSGTTTSFISATPSQLSFAYELHEAAPPNQSTQIVSNGISLPLTFGTNYGNCSSNWFQASLSTNSTPATLTISINTANLTAGSCTGNVSLNSTTPTNGSTSTLVGITLFISSSALLNISVPAGLQSLTLQQGGRPVQFTTTNNPPNPLTLTSSDPTTQVNFTLTTSSTDGWLTASPTSGTTPANINVEIVPGTVLAVGTYNGSITVTSSGLLNNSTTIPITLTITSSNSISVSPSGSQSFTELQGGTLPNPITLTLTGAAAQNSTFTTSVIQGSGGAWLQVTPANGALTGTPTSSSALVTLSVAANVLTQGTYSSQAVITFQSSSIPQILISVSLTVQPPASQMVATPSAVTFSYQAGAAAPAAQSITITNPAGSQINYTVASVSDSWFSVSPSSGSTTGTVTVSVSPQSLQPGSYNGSFTLTAPNVTTLTVPVSLFVSASTTPQPFIISNAASGVGSQLSPGELITLKGSGLGPGVPVSFTVASLTNPTLSGVQVTFNGYSGTLLYVSSTQINVTVPYEIAGTASATIVVTYQGLQSSPITQPVAAASLGIFTDNATGMGQAAVINQNYTYNTAATPAPEGSYISVYATGGGQTAPASTDGEVTPTLGVSPLVLQQYVTATIGGKPATVAFAGAAPGDVTGVVQFNIQVPTGISGSALPIVISISGPTSTQSQTGATVAVQ
jgi:trimeric autotransporter adhesin